MAVFTEAAKAHKGDVLVVHVASAESKVLEYFGIKKESLPALVCADLSGESQMKKYYYSGAYEADAVSAFIGQFLNGEIKPVLKSEEVTAEDTASPVKVVKGKSFNDIVINNDRDVFVEFYAPWCGHCKKLAPTWDALGEKFADSTTVTIAKTDATANEFDYPGLTIRGFPTIYFFKGNDKANPVRYEEGRELEDFVNFLKNNGANPVTVAVEGNDEL
jgi:protein disulfide-isomerase A1